jgi:hypothetical protein
MTLGHGGMETRLEHADPGAACKQATDDGEDAA